MLLFILNLYNSLMIIISAVKSRRSTERKQKVEVVPVRLPSKRRRVSKYNDEVTKPSQMGVHIIYGRVERADK